MEIISKYLNEVTVALSTGSAREHAYRPAFQKLIELMRPDLKVINDPARSEHGAPDFVFLKGDLTIGYTETKDLDANLDREEKSDQMDRYLGYSNLILTNYLEFRFFRNGERYGEAIIVGTLRNGVVVPNEKNYEILERTIKDFLNLPPEKIKSGARLATIMGGKARRIRLNVSHYINDKSEKSAELLNVYEVMKKLLVHDMEPEDFADMYAQTLVYGLFVARYHDNTPDTFTRQEARDLVPASNPLLQHFFDHIVGANFDKRLAFIVNELCEIFSVADVKKLMEDYYSRQTLWGETKDSPDPVIHFYEDFLKEYDSKQRLKIGAFYTPIPVVKFIVRSIDYILKNDFGLINGLADTQKRETTRIVQGQKRKEQVHTVQILDPAVGTGTFLNEVIRHIHRSFEGQGGRWESYVDEDLLPRIYGFELMMSPYTIAHLKLGMTLRDMGYNKFSKRLGIYLTNSLEEGHKIEGTLFESFGFMQSISEESEKASMIKNEKPIMVVLGNPPYSVSSSNKSKWILNLIKDYKKDLNERKINLDDDYIKFIRFSEHFIEKNGSGIVAMITNNSFIDGVTHRQMRKHLLETFDDIYILDLHGSTVKKETTLNGGKDENVFDIQQGVSISIFVRTSKNKKKLGKVHHTELFGLRSEKYEKLNTNSVETIKWKKIDYQEPYYFFVPKDFSLIDDYHTGFSVKDIFINGNTGIQTKRDSLTIRFNEYEFSQIINDFESLSDAEIKTKYALCADGRDWSINDAKKDIKNNHGKIKKIFYRPFDIRYTLYTGTTKGFQAYPRNDTSKHIIAGDNVSLITLRLNGERDRFVVMVSNHLVEKGSLASGNYSFFPLYLYNEDGTRKPNFNSETLEKIKLNLQGEVKPEAILDYIYAVLYSPIYRKKYKEFLKIDFPRVPYPKDNETFWKLVEKGRELRSLHLLESLKLSSFITTFPESGTGEVEKVKYEDGKVYINNNQYIGNVPEIAWNFYIGGYQPAQKWLKDRKGTTLSNQDLEHYQKIIVALVETDKLMKEIDEIKF